jgi:hypothetical protein
MHVNPNRGGGEEVGDVGAYGDAFRNACCRKAATNLWGTNVDVKRDVRDSYPRSSYGRGDDRLYSFGGFGPSALATIRDFRSERKEFLSESSCPKDRTLKATAGLGIATRPHKISSLDFDKSIPILSTLVERRWPEQGARQGECIACSAVTMLPLRAQGTLWPSSCVRFYNGFLAGTFVDLASSSASRL